MPKLVTVSDTRLRSAKPRDKEYNIAAGDGLYLRVSPAGGKSWLFNYFRPFTGKRSNIGIGKYPVVSLADAKEKRDEYRRLLAKGLDPQAVRDEHHEQMRTTLSNTFKAVYDEWKELKQSKVSHVYFERLTRAMDLHVIPALGDAPVTQLTAPRAIQALQPLSRKRNLETLRKICGWLNEVMVWCVNTGRAPSNPLSGIGEAFDAPTVTNRPTIKPDELPGLLRALDAASITLETRCALEWLMHTLVRPIEGTSAEWAEIDTKKALWRIPAEKMKMSRDHVVPLTPQAMKILEIMEPLSGHRRYVFPSHTDPKEHMHPETPNRALQRMGYKGKLVAHGLRALGSTTLNEEGFDAELIEVSLAHVDGSVRGDYNRAEYIERRRSIMEWWSNHIDKAARAGRKN